MGLAVLCTDLVQYYEHQQLLGTARDSVARLESLNQDYDGLLIRLQTDPNMIRRIAPVTLGAEYDDPNVIHPRARVAELAVARKALLREVDQSNQAAAVPAWLVRCSDPRRRRWLFGVGAALILVALTCFTSGPAPTGRRR